MQPGLAFLYPLKTLVWLDQIKKIHFNPICTALFHTHFWPGVRRSAEPLRCWNFYRIFAEVFPLSKKHSFNPKTNFLETVLKQAGEKKREMAVLARKLQKQQDFLICRVRLIFLKHCREKLSFCNHILVNKDETMYPNKFSQPTGKCISHSYWK